MFIDVQLQFLLDGTNIAAAGGAKGKMQSGDDSGTHGSSRDKKRMDKNHIRKPQYLPEKLGQHASNLFDAEFWNASAVFFFRFSADLFLFFSFPLQESPLQFLIILTR